MAAGILMLLVGVAVLSRLFRHDLAGRVATMNLTGGTVGSASAEASAAGGGSGGAGVVGGAASGATVQGPATPGSNTAGFPTGPADSGRALAGGVGGNWDGSMPRALAIARTVGATPSSQKRTRRLTASGNVSDHYVGATHAYAVDLPTSGAAGDALYAKVIRSLGLDPARYPSGRWQNITIGGYRYQVGWRVPGHYDHVHVGVRRGGTP